MRKNGSRLISLRQYRFTDLFLFAAILVGFELIVHYAQIAFHGEFTFSPMVAIVLLVMVRWGWESVFFAVGDGLLLCLLNMGTENFTPSHFAVYIIGNACIMLVFLLFKLVGKQKIANKWYWCVLTVIAAWLLVVLGRATVHACFGVNFATAFVSQLFDCFSLFVGIIIILIMRKLDGMFEDQKQYLIRKDKERKEMARRDDYGDEPIDVDEESLSILNKKDDDLY